MNPLTQPIQPDSLRRTWHVAQRLDGSITVYYTRTGIEAHFVVFDSLDNLFSLAAENERLWRACNLLIAYRDAAGPLNFQLEKADDFINMMRAALAKVEE